MDRKELEQKAKQLVTKIKRADEFKAAQEKISDAARTELRLVMSQLGVDHIEVPEVDKQADLRDDFQYIFDVARILQSIPAEELEKAKAVSLKSEGFDKLVRTHPDIADARMSKKKDEQKLSISSIKKQK